jgi:hypothetical protein
MDHIIDIKCLYCGQHCNIMNALFLLSFMPKGVGSDSHARLNAIRSDLADRPNCRGCGMAARLNCLGCDMDTRHRAIESGLATRPNCRGCIMTIRPKAIRFGLTTRPKSQNNKKYFKKNINLIFFSN